MLRPCRVPESLTSHNPNKLAIIHNPKLCSSAEALAALHHLCLETRFSLGSWAPPHTLIHTGAACVCPNLLHAFPSLHFLPSKNKARGSPSSLPCRQEAMSLAPSIPSIKVKVGGVAAVAVSPPRHRACRSSFAVIRSSKAEGAPRRPAAPPLSPPPKTPTLSTPPTLSQPPTPVKPAAPSSSPPPSQDPEPKQAAAPVAVAAPAAAGAVTLEYQRKVAKDLQDYFKQKKLDEADQGPFFGFLGKNEISNGRYVCPAPPLKRFRNKFVNEKNSLDYLHDC